MPLNDKIRNISLMQLVILIILSYFALLFLKSVNIPIDNYWIYFIVILFFIYKLKDCKQEFVDDARHVFDKFSFKHILVIVMANIFFSYGMLYLANYLITIPQFKQFITFDLISKTSLVIGGGYFAKVLISPISEELIFRGVILNKLRLFVPLTFAVAASSLLFGSFHHYGSMVSAIVFAVCMCILYLKTENILVPIFAHFLNNLFAETIYTFDYNSLLFTNGLVVNAVSVLAVISLVYLISFILKELNSIKYA